MIPPRDPCWGPRVEATRTPPGDTLFAIGAMVLGWFVLGLQTGWSLERRGARVAAGSTEITPGGVEPEPDRA